MFNYSLPCLLYRGLNKVGIYLPRFMAKLIARTTEKVEEITGVEPVKLNTYDGSNQAVHPDVVLTDGLGLGGYRYWMAVTPYPFSVDHFENPSIFKSRDGVLWEAGASNPIVLPTRRENAHLSDPALIWEKEAKQLRLFYRETQYRKQGMTNLILTTTSKDGAHWKPSTVIFKSKRDDLCLSPSAVVNSGKIEVFYVSTLQNRYRLKKKSFRRDCKGGIGENFESSDEKETICQIDGGPAGRFLWHIDILKTPARYLGLFVFAREPGDMTKLYLGTSTDCGLTWRIEREITVTDRNKQERAFRNIYRSCLVPATTEAGSFDLYISAQLHDYSWYIFHRPGFTI